MTSLRTYRTNAIVLDKTKLKETDLILTLLAEDGRQIRAVAKGARKPGSRLAARCELFSTADLLIARGKNLDIISQAELLEAPLASALEYERVNAAAAVAEVAKYSCYEDVRDPFVYPITQKCLRYMGSLDISSAQLALLVAAFSFKLLAHAGYRPELSSCVLCGDLALSHFSVSAGGLICSSCAKTVPGAQKIDPKIVGWLDSLIRLTFDKLLASQIDTSTADELAKLACSWASTHLDVRLRGLEFMLGD